MKKIQILDYINTKRTQHRILIRRKAIQGLRHNYELQAQPSQTIFQTNTQIISLVKNIYSQIPDFKQLEIFKSLQEKEIKIILRSIVFIRKLMCQNIANLIIDKGYLFSIINLFNSQIKQIQFQALWTLNNFCSLGQKYCNALAEKGFIQICFNILKQDFQWQFKQLAIWSLGNIAVDQNQNRKQLINSNIFQIIIKVAQQSQCHQIKCITAWTISVIVRNKPYPSSKKTEMIPPFLNALQLDKLDIGLIKDIIWCLAVLAQIHLKNIKAVTKYLNWKILNQFLKSDKQQLKFPIIRLYGNIFSSSSEFTRSLPTPNFRLLLEIYQKVPKKIKREILWCIGNILSTSQQVSNKFILQSGYLQFLINQLKKELPIIKKQIFYIIKILVKMLKDQIIINKLYFMKISFFYVNQLQNQNVKYIQQALSSLKAVFFAQKCIGSKLLIKQFSQAGGDLKLLQLQSHKNSVIYSLVYELLKLINQEVQECFI